MLRRLACVLLLTAGAGLLAACGGHLPSEAGDIARDLNPVSCAIARATQEHENWKAAAALREAGREFPGSERDDLSVRQSRRLVFGQRIADLTRMENVVERLEADGEASDEERVLLNSASSDLTAGKALMTYDRDTAPTPRAADDAPPDIPNALQLAVDRSEEDVKEAIGTCTLPPDLRARSRAYEG